MSFNPESGSEQKLDARLEKLVFNQRRYVASRRRLLAPDGKEIRLRAKTCRIFELLAHNANEVVSRETLISEVWGDIVVTDDSLTQCIGEILRPLSRFSIVTTTVRSVSPPW